MEFWFHKPPFHQVAARQRIEGILVADVIPDLLRIGHIS